MQLQWSLMCNGHNFYAPVRRTRSVLCWQGFPEEITGEQVQTTKMIEKTSTVEVVVNIKYIFICITQNNCIF